MSTPQFNIKIKGYRAISEADIYINGITVLSGNNGCGKSTIALYLYNFIFNSNSIDKIIRNELVKKVKIPFNLLLEFVKEISKHIDYNYIKKLSNDLNNFEKYIINQSSLTDIKFKIVGIIDEIHTLYENNEAIINNNESLNNSTYRINKLIVDYLINAPNSGLNTKDYLHPLDVNLETLRRVFLFQIDYYISIEPSYPSYLISIRIQDIYKEYNPLPNYYEVIEHTKSIYNSNKAEFESQHTFENIFYIDSPNMLENQNEFNPKHWNHLQEKLRNSTTNHTFIEEIDNLFYHNLQIEHIIHTTTFEETYSFQRTDGKIFNLFESATGIKSFAIIYLLFKNNLLNKETLLILDEPEVYLHPEWVVEYARLVVLLNKLLGVKFLIASHSPEFVSAIRYISEKEGILKKTDYYIAEKNINNTYSFKRSDYNIEDIFKSFNKSIERFDALMKEGVDEV